MTHDWGLAQGWSFFRPHLRSGVQGASGGAQRGYSEKAMLGLGGCSGFGSSKSGDRSAPSTSGGNGSPASEATVGSASPRAESVTRGAAGRMRSLHSQRSNDSTRRWETRPPARDGSRMMIGTLVPSCVQKLFSIFESFQQKVGGIHTSKFECLPQMLCLCGSLFQTIKQTRDRRTYSPSCLRASHTAVEIVTQQNAGDVHEAGPAPAVVAYQRCDRVVLVAEILQRSKSVPNIPIRERYGRAIDASAISNKVGKSTAASTH